LSTSCPSLRTKRKRISLTTTTTTSTPRVNAAGPFSGLRIPRIDSTLIQSAATSNIAETTAEDNGSALPCPYGCSASAGAAATTTPRQTTRELTTSASDSTASATKACEWPMI